MTRYTGFLFSIALLMSPISLAQSACPDGFRYAGTLSGYGSFSTDVDKMVYVKLPIGAKLDTSYQQTQVTSTNDRSGTHSQLRPEEIPKGIYISPRGKSDQIYEPTWAVSKPELSTVQGGANGKKPRYQFGMKLFCKVGNIAANPQFGSCDVEVEVCYKPLK